MPLNLIYNFVTNVRLTFFGRPITKFVQEIVQNPFSARTDLVLKQKYHFYKQRYPFLVLNKGERIILNFILVRDYETMVNELPHFFYLTLKYQSAIHSVPNVGCLNPADYKSGDLIVEKFGISVKTKSHFFFCFANFYDLKTQYALNPVINPIWLNLLYAKKQAELSDQLIFVKKIL
jgi:hypothetical protein